MRKGGVLQYLHADHLGSMVLVADQSGDTVGEQQYFVGACPELAEGEHPVPAAEPYQRNIHSQAKSAM